MSQYKINLKRSKRNNISLQVTSDGTPRTSESNKTDIPSRPVKKTRQETVMPNEKDTILEGFENSVGTIIKQHAQAIYRESIYHKLNDTQKNAISTGFNSILDLTDNDSNEDSQRRLFTDIQWAELNRLFNKQKKWTSINNDIQKKLKAIEKLAKTDLKAAYVACLKHQITYAMTSDETYFEIYAFVLKTLHKKPCILNSASKEKFSEGDYVITLWSRIFEAVFNDSEQQIFCKWGDTVSEDSSLEKKNSQDANDTTIGDKVDLRVCTLSPSRKTIDLLSVEFAKDSSSNKFFSDHRKVLREARINADRFYKSQFLRPRDKKIIRGQCMQIAGPAGQISEVKLVDNGLYVASHLGSLRLPSSQTNLRDLRTLLERLFTIKDSVVTRKAYYNSIEHQERSQEKSMEAKLNAEISPYSPSFSASPQSISSPESSSSTARYISWVRGAWFPPSPKKNIRYDGKWNESLFSPSN